ncbi:MAG: response regulator [Pseudomonadota bacterium]
MYDNARILVVDDEESIRQGLKIALQRKGFDVETREEGLPALIELKTAFGGGQPYHYVVLDIQLPDINGLQLLEIIKACYPDLPVLVISGYGNEKTVEAVQLRRGSAYLDKPFGVQELLDQLERLHVAALPPAHPPSPASPLGPMESAFALVRLASGAEPVALYERIGACRGVCTCDAVVGDRDFVVLLQALDRRGLQETALGVIAAMPGVQDVELCFTRRPTLSDETWRVLQDFVGAPERVAAWAVPGRPRERVAWVMLEVEPERQAQIYVQLHMLDKVIQCDAIEDESRLLLLVRDDRPAPHPCRVPDRVLGLAGVRRARVLCVLPMDLR